MATVRVIKNWQDPDEGWCFWKGETFAAMSGPPYSGWVEVKTRGEYVALPGDVVEVID